MVCKNIDIHRYERRVVSAIASIRRSDLSLENKEALDRFTDALRLEGISPPRIAKYLGTLRIVGLAIRKDFREATKGDLERFVLAIKARQELSVWTKRDYAVTIRKFYSWLQGDGKRPPEKVACISTTLRKKDQPRIKKSELLTEGDIRDLLRGAKNVRDFAFVSMLWDTGARIGELGGMHVGDVTFEENYMLVDLRGKTGQRTVLACESTKALLTWLDVHPRRDDPTAPLWVSMYGDSRRLEPMNYGVLWAVVRSMFRRAGVRKHFNPHLFRHSRATWCVEHDWSTYELCRHFGWEIDSHMPAVYLSLSDKFVHDKMLKTYGLSPSREVTATARCARCQSLLAIGRSFCATCGLPTSRKPAYEERLLAESTRDRRTVRTVRASGDVASESGHPGSDLPPLPPVPQRPSSIRAGGPASP